MLRRRLDCSTRYRVLDGGKTTHSPTFMPVWVGKSDYVVIPKCVGDTMAMNRADSIAYAVFMADTADVLAQ